MGIFQRTGLVCVVLLAVVSQYRCTGSEVVQCDHERQEDTGRRCTKSCEADKDCLSSKKKCLCDGKCGKSCINPNLRCLPHPTDIKHGRISISPYNRFGALAWYSCDDGYILVGLHTRVCQGDETWMGEEPKCEMNHGRLLENQTCGPPPRIDNGDHDGEQHRGRYNLNTNLRYRCLPGFTQHKESVISAWCVTGGVWIGPNMTCSASGCNAPPEISNGYIEIPSVITVGSRIKYSCDSTYFLVGSAERSCLRDGSWDGREPSCQQVVCGPPPTVENAAHDAPKDQFRFLIGTILTYTCTFGYYKEGTERAICSKDEGRWVGPSMSCKARDCGVPGEINNGWRDPGYRFTYPTRVTYQCNEGFEMQGQSPYRDCQADGEWSGVLPDCKPIKCRELGPPVHGTMIGSGRDYGAVIRFDCNKGHRVVGSAERTCQADSTWSGQETFCEETNCGFPGPLWNGYVTGQGTSVGDIVYYRCNIRTNLNGTFPSSECQENGVWSHDIPQCLGQCQIPFVLNGSIIKEHEGFWVKHGFVAHFTCHNGLVLNDSRPVLCENGTWSMIPKCVPAPCNQPPPQIAEGHRVFFHLAHKSRARYFCIAGYKLTDSHRYMTCEFGQWVGVRPRCQENFCPNPGTLTNGDIFKIGTYGKFQFSHYIVTIKHGDRLEYTCGKEHKLVGPKGAACVNGKWSPSEKPKCVRSQHPIFNKLWHPFEENV